jgi:type IX secretion system PorP/SprF family membrane protein
MNKLRGTICLLILMSWKFANAQDISFSQFTVAAPYYNPAYVASFDGNYRVSLVNRDQWIGFADKAFRSFSIAGDIKFDFNRQEFNKDFFGAGIYFISDKAPLFDFNTNEANIMLSFHKLVDKHRKNYLSAGFGFGVTQKSVNYESINFQDQFNGVNDYNLPSRELLPPNIFARPDLKFGVQYNAQINKTTRLQSGVSCHYLLGPDFSFYRDFNSIDYSGSKTFTAFRRINLSGSLSYLQNKHNIYSPRILYSIQGPHQLILAGLQYKRTFYNLNQTAVHFGILSRISNSQPSFALNDLGLTTGFEWKNVIVGLHYDFGIRDGIRYNKPTHSFEFSISLIGNYDNEGFICPEF